MKPFWAIQKHSFEDLQCVLTAIIFSELLEKEKILASSNSLKGDFFYYLQSDLEKKFYVGRDRVRKAFKLLEDKGYITTDYFINQNYKRRYIKINHCILGGENHPSSVVEMHRSVGGEERRYIGGENRPSYKETIINKETINKEISLNIKLGPEWVLRKWNSLGDPFKKARGLGKTRKKQIEKHLKAVTTKEEWEDFFNKIKESSFLKGVAAKEDVKYSFNVNLDWCLKDDKFFGILEGKYDDKGGNNLANDGQGLDEIYKQYS
tara:strand:- start:534 stop:1325 length:792 start_codon:yes stop_codon:yes gene_type:complete